MHQRGEYGSVRMGVEASSAPRVTTETSVLVNLGIISIGVTIGVLAWPSLKKQQPIGAIALGAAGSMVAAGIISLFPQRLWFNSAQKSTWS